MQGEDILLDVRQTLELKNLEDPWETAHHVMDLDLPANKNLIVGLLLSDSKIILYLFDFHMESNSRDFSFHWKKHQVGFSFGTRLN